MDVDVGDDAETGTGNTSDSVAPSTATVESDCSLFTFVVYVVVFGTIVVFGLVGNGLSWVVLAWDRRVRGRVASFLLRTMAVADNLFLTAAGLAQISSALIFYIDSSGYRRTVDVKTENLSAYGENSSDHVSTTSVSPDPKMSPSYNDVAAAGGGSLYDDVSAYVTTYVTVCVFPLVHVTQMWTVWITVLVALSRYVAICRPYQAPRLCTMRRVRQQVAAVALAVLFYNVPRFLEYRVKYFGDQVTFLFNGKMTNTARENYQHRAGGSFQLLCRDYNCDSTTIRLRSDYDVSRAPASIQRDSTRAKNEHVSFSS